MTRDDFGHKAAPMCGDLALDMYKAMLSAFDALTEEERGRIGNEAGPYLIVRAIAMVVGQRVLSDRFDCGAIKWMIPRIKRILNGRVY